MKRLLPLATLVTVLTAATSTQAKEVYDFSMPSAVTSSVQPTSIWTPKQVSPTPYKDVSLFAPRVRTENELTYDALLEYGKDKLAFKREEVSILGVTLYEVRLRPDYVRIKDVNKKSYETFGFVFKGRFK